MKKIDTANIKQTETLPNGQVSFFRFKVGNDFGTIFGCYK